MRRETRPSSPRTLPGKTLAFGLALSLLGALGGPLPGALAPAPATAADGSAPHPVLRGFQPTGKYVFVPKGGAKSEAPPKPEAPGKPKTEAPPKPDAKPETSPPSDPPPQGETSPEPKGEPGDKPGPTSEPGSEPKTEPNPDVKPVAPTRRTAPNGGPLIGPPPEPAPAPKPPEKPKKPEKPEKPAVPPTGPRNGNAKPADAPAVKTSAGVYYSRRASAYLVLGSPLGRPFLVRTGMNAVESIPKESLLARDDGSLDLRSDVTLTALGAFTLVDSDIAIDVAGVAGRLTPPPFLLGWQTAAELLAHTPEYARDAKACPMDATCLASMRTCAGEVRVVVYFGSWCSSCAHLLGRILRLEQEINKDVKEGGKPVIRFDYYGLPAPPATWTEPEAVLRDLDHLPTAIVFVNGAYCTRIGAADLGRPDVALQAALLGR